MGKCEYFVKFHKRLFGYLINCLFLEIDFVIKKVSKHIQLILDTQKGSKT